MTDKMLIQIQKQVLGLVAEKYPQVYLVGGTAINLLYGHRISEDLDFFSQEYSGALHREIVSYIRKAGGYRFRLIHEERRKQFLPMAIYEFDTGKRTVLKVDFVKDVVPLIRTTREDGIASAEDIYYRKILAAIGWTKKESLFGGTIAGGRQKTKDLFDIFFLSSNVEPLSECFVKYFDRPAYERLTAWYLRLPKQKTVMELLDWMPGSDPRAVFKHLDGEIIEELNRKYLNL